MRFLRESLEDLEEIVLYIAQDNPVAALKMHDEIIAKANNLSFFPKLGRLVPERKIAAAGYRMLIIKPYLVFYRMIDQTVFIYRVLHGATNYPTLYERIMTEGSCK